MSAENVNTVCQQQTVGDRAVVDASLQCIHHYSLGEVHGTEQLECFPAGRRPAWEMNGDLSTTPTHR